MKRSSFIFHGMEIHSRTTGYLNQVVRYCMPAQAWEAVEQAATDLHTALHDAFRVQQDNELAEQKEGQRP